MLSLSSFGCLRIQYDSRWIDLIEPTVSFLYVLGIIKERGLRDGKETEIKEKPPVD